MYSPICHIVTDTVPDGSTVTYTLTLTHSHTHTLSQTHTLTHRNMLQTVNVDAVSWHIMGYNGSEATHVAVTGT